MSDLTAPGCGCGRGDNCSPCNNNMMMILLLFLCGGCGNKGMFGGCGCSDKNNCDWIIWLLLLTNCCGC
ncbi:MAG: chorion class high-cysteine HCB protein 13 [Lachnospiraceae bacterium]|nr:chorion class high-cysteine HCB protein 13 [Lachnospiraceae bacterium]